MVIFAMFKWHKLLHYKEILPIYWMTLVMLNIEPRKETIGLRLYTPIQ